MKRVFVRQVKDGNVLEEGHWWDARDEATKEEEDTEYGMVKTNTWQGE
jgi:hypothetical protein